MDRKRELEALSAMLEFSMVRAEDLGLDALAYSLESAIKIAQIELASTETSLTNLFGSNH